MSSGLTDGAAVSGLSDHEVIQLGVLIKDGTAIVVFKFIKRKLTNFDAPVVQLDILTFHSGPGGWKIGKFVIEGLLLFVDANTLEVKVVIIEHIFVHLSISIILFFIILIDLIILYNK